MEDNEMKTPKTVSGKVIQANRENAKKSTGPRGKSGKLAVRNNAMKHGLLTSRVTFQNGDEEQEFNTLVDDLYEEFKPKGISEALLVEEIATCWWKLRTAAQWGLQDFRSRRKASLAFLNAFNESSDEIGDAISDQHDRLRAAAKSGWECREVLITVGGNKAEGEDEVTGEPTQTSAKTQLQARLGSSGETLLRYETAWRRDLYRAIEILRKIQGARRAAGSPTS
jgi:hypothetical protein